MSSYDTKSSGNIGSEEPGYPSCSTLLEETLKLVHAQPSHAPAFETW